VTSVTYFCIILIKIQNHCTVIPTKLWRIAWPTLWRSRTNMTSSVCWDDVTTSCSRRSGNVRLRSFRKHVLYWIINSEIRTSICVICTPHWKQGQTCQTQQLCSRTFSTVDYLKQDRCLLIRHYLMNSVFLFLIANAVWSEQK